MSKPQGKQMRAGTRYNYKQNQLPDSKTIIFKLLQEREQLEKKIASLERKLHKIGEAEDQRDWLLDELTKKITTIGEIRTNLLKRERLSAIGELSSRLAHDVRNPLSIILNTVDLIKTKHIKDFSPEVTKLFLMIDRATSRISFQLDEVLNFVRTSPLEIQPHSLLGIIASSIDRLIIHDSIVISKPSVDFNINCDSRKLEAVFSNLIMNATQAMKNHGKIDIRIFENGENITITVEDSGPGMPNNIIEKIFDPLFTTKSRGTGLGLATVKNLVERHFGNVTVKTNPTTFSITLPNNLKLNNSD
jgi:two-component system sensor histidine kinase HydH